MKPYPSIPHVADAPEGLLREGHLWLLEKIDGAHLRFQLCDSGLLRFGDRERVYADADDLPDAYGHAVRHVRERLDRDALRAAVDDVEDLVFFGEATHRHAIDYDWERTPSFLGFDVWSERAAAFRPPDAVEAIYEALGLHPVNAVEREVNTRDFDPDDYAVPDSAWYDGPAAGVVLRDKQGRRAEIPHPDYRGTADAEPVDASATELAERYATRRRFERCRSALRDRGYEVTVDALYERTLADVLRTEHGRLRGEGGNGDAGDGFDERAFRGALAARTRAFLDDARDR